MKRSIQFPHRTAERQLERVIEPLVIECSGLDEAVSIAQRIPTLPFGGTIEVRPVESA